tara:strand:+ start:1134 stop:1406 length:273 start_codon:yes stop_codon:yes gene_type:complete
MQKLINVVALLSGLTSAALIGGGVFIYLQKDALIDGVKEQVTKHATEAITSALPGMLDNAMPELPSVTGGAIPNTPATGNVTGSAIPTLP